MTLRSDVLFHFAKSSLTPRAQGVLRYVAARIKTRAIGSVQVTGYTDSIGSDAVNIPLSQARARSVVSALSRLTPGVAYQSAGRGEADPVAPNTKPDGSDNPAGRALNRRVTIAFSVRAPAKPTPPPAPAQTSPSATGQSMSFTLGNRQIDQVRYDVTVDSLFREGGLLVARLTIPCAATNPSSSQCAPYLDLAGTQTVPPQQPIGGHGKWSLQAAHTISGFHLLDPATGTQYIPLHAGNATPVAGGIGDLVDTGQRYRTWAYFPAPPATVSRITLVAPNDAARVGGMPIAAGPPAP